jgi:biopolymer transport protein ExbB
MKKVFAIIALMGVFTLGMNQAYAQDAEQPAASEEVNTNDEQAKADEAAAPTDAAPAENAETAATDSTQAEGGETVDVSETDEAEENVSAEPQVVSDGFFKGLKRKFIEGDAFWMSLPTLALIFGLAFCIERIVYLTLADVNTKKMKEDIEDALVNKGNVEAAKDIARNTRGPVASLYYQGLLRADEGAESIDKAVVAYGAVQSSNLEKGCSWITLFIAMAPSLGFLGTVIGMVQAFDDIQAAGDISPTVVAGGMKVALLTTILGIVVALILQLLYNYILSKIEGLTAEMENSSIDLLDTAYKYQVKKARK